MHTSIKLICLLILAIAPAHAMQNGNDLGAQLLIAAASGNHQEMERLINAGAPVNHQDVFGTTALLAAAQHDHLDCLQKLIAAKANVNMPNSKGKTALMAAAHLGHLYCLMPLTDAKAQINQADSEGSTALMYAAARGHRECVDLLIALGAQVNQAEKDGKTALMWAANNGHLGCIHALIEEGAEVNLETNNGQAALIQAAGRGHLECVQTLFNAGVLVKHAALALTVAAKQGHKPVYEELAKRCENVVKRMLQPTKEDKRAVIALLGSKTQRKNDSKCLFNKHQIPHDIVKIIGRSVLDASKQEKKKTVGELIRQIITDEETKKHLLETYINN